MRTVSSTTLTVALDVPARALAPWIWSTSFGAGSCSQVIAAQSRMYYSVLEFVSGEGNLPAYIRDLHPFQYLNRLYVPTLVTIHSPTISPFICLPSIDISSFCQLLISHNSPFFTNCSQSLSFYIHRRYCPLQPSSMSPP